MTDIRDAGPRMRQMNDVLGENERLRGRLAWTERERDSLRRSIKNLAEYIAELNDEIERLRAAIRPESYEKRDEKRVFYDTKSPRNGALSGCETVPDPDSRVWETPCTPQTHATPPQGSVKVRDSRNAIEPVAWAVEAGGELEASFCGRTGLEDAADWREQSDGTIVPLYRQPQTCPHVRGNVTQYCSLNFTLTDEERKAVEAAADEFAALADQCDCRTDATTAATLRGLLERTGGEG